MSNDSKLLTSAELWENGYECRRAESEIIIDGDINKSVWATADVIPLVIPVTLDEPISKTQGRLLYDDKFLYVAFRAYDKDVWSYHTERDSQTCGEDVLEVFFKTHPDKEPYINFEINALGTIYDAYNIRRGASGGDDHHRWARWNCDGLKLAVVVKGTINNPEDEDEYWQLEMAIPFADLPPLNGRAPKAGDRWSFHLARYDYSVYLPEGKELSSCAPLSIVSFHRYEEWLPLKFV